jgi:hypothetical protein
MFVFKNIDISSTVNEQNVVSYKHFFTSASAGITSINIVSGSISESYWNSLNVLFYTSGSPLYKGENKFSVPSSNLSIAQPGVRIENGTEINGQYLHKFHGYPSSSIIQIPQQHYGEKIKEKSFKLVSKAYSDNNNINPIIRDDGKGNLYSTNAHHSQSTNAESHSDNYVGNIFYDKGLAVITETGSWSGSVNYSDLVSNNNKFILDIKSYNTIATREYSITLQPNEFNHSTNYSLRMPLSGSYNNMAELTSSIQSNPYLASQFTGSNFTPYITTINFYQKNDMDTPVMVAKLPKPIRKSKRISTTFKIRFDL